jgi:hypothetical protein
MMIPRSERPPLHELLRLIEQAKSPTMLASQWRVRIGAELTTSLVRLGVLVEKEPPSSHPCEGPWGDGCPRRVVENHGCTSHPFVAVCGRGDGSCPEILLRAEDRETLALSVDGMVRVLRRALGISGAIERDDAGFPDARRIGERGGRAVFLVLLPAFPGFEAWLAGRGDALVVVPFGGGLATAARDRFGVGQRVGLVLLRDVLRLEGGTIVGALPEPVLVLREPPGVPYGSRSPTCIVIDNDGRRALDAAEYLALVARARELDLFVDTTVTVDGGAHRGLRRDDDGVVQEAALTKHEAAAIVELISTRKALRAGDFGSLSLNAIDKVVERARSKIDVKQGRYKWRAIHTLAADTPEAKRWQFNPPPGFDFAAIFPLDQSIAKSA